MPGRPRPTKRREAAVTGSIAPRRSRCSSPTPTTSTIMRLKIGQEIERPLILPDSAPAAPEFLRCAADPGLGDVRDPVDDHASVAAFNIISSLIMLVKDKRHRYRGAADHGRDARLDHAHLRHCRHRHRAWAARCSALALGLVIAANAEAIRAFFSSLARHHHLPARGVLTSPRCPAAPTPPRCSP